MTPRREFLKQAALATAAAALPGNAPAAESPWRIGCYTRPWDKMDYLVALDAVAEAGFKHAGLMTTNTKSRLVLCVDSTPDDAVRAGEEAKKRGLSIPSVYGGGFRAEKSVADGVAGLRHLVDLCALCGCPSLLLGGNGKAEVQEAYYTCVAECCAYAAEKKVELVLKPHGGLNATGPQLRDILRGVNHPNFRAWYDAGNILYYSDGARSPAEDAAPLAGRITGWCIKDWQPPKDVALTPGDGKVDFPAVLAALRRGGLTGGSLVVECLKPGDPASLLAQALRARLFVEQLFAG